jgi:hypothetical protein
VLAQFAQCGFQRVVVGDAEAGEKLLQFLPAPFFPEIRQQGVEQAGIRIQQARDKGTAIACVLQQIFDGFGHGERGVVMACFDFTCICDK